HLYKSGGAQRAPAALAAAERPHPSGARRRRPIPYHGGDRSHATATVAPLSSPRNSTSHPVLMSALGGGPTPRRGRSQPPRARGGGALTLPDSRARAQVLFLILL